MTISELIKQLQEMQEEYGTDAHVNMMVWDERGNGQAYPMEIQEVAGIEGMPGDDAQVYLVPEGMNFQVD